MRNDSPSPLPSPSATAASGALEPTLLPFQGVRFTAHVHGDLATVIGPPTDIDSTDSARDWVREREINAVHLEIEDDGDPLRFTDARRQFEDWRRNGILAADNADSYYVYDQSFDDHGVRRTRRGTFGLVPLDAPDVCVLPHEATWEDNRLRRLQLLRDLHAAVSPIFLIYESPESHAALDAVTQRPPDAEATDEFGNTHRLWRVGDPFEVESVRATMQGRHYYIADGHHRFEAARAYHDEVNGMDSNLVLACCVEAADPGIVIRPIHRLLHATRTDIDTFSGRLTQSFELRTEPVGKRSGLDLLRALPDDDTPVAGIISNGGTQFTITRLRTPETIDDPAERLDVSIITSQLIHGALGVAAEESETEISYIDNADEVLESTRRGDAALGILLRPVRLSQVLDVARAHGRVPAKSTSFTPKVPVGLVMQAFDDRDA